jgi:hypothetical protein
MSRWAPFGFNQDGTLNTNEFEALLKAEFYLKQGCTLQTVRDWLVEQTGKSITIPGLKKTLEHAKKIKHQKDDRAGEPGSP